MSLPEEDVEFLDAYAAEQGIESRSAALHAAVSVLRAGQLADAYEDAWTSWDDSGEAETWDVAVGDGLES
ncbi:ribbon-helix-helix domain-containing protein [Amycolatopsis benzoatilytica]|uniref:ribbon-helix-helix domain-containing protein n=1 Tax=Amycolatopsis benzoatilytica TaxID=346045 RepID=UPI00037502D1|nr:ribbon-helix-helix domain-containing protein [Amycolatopsis benzoatilytica]